MFLGDEDMSYADVPPSEIDSRLKAIERRL